MILISLIVMILCIIDVFVVAASLPFDKFNYGVKLVVESAIDVGVPPFMDNDD